MEANGDLYQRAFRSGVQSWLLPGLRSKGIARHKGIFKKKMTGNRVSRQAR
jgi:hypothetical protein